VLPKENIGKKIEHVFCFNMKLDFEFIYSVNVEEGGVCYRLYPHSLFDEKINENVNSEMARQPLLVSLTKTRYWMLDDAQASDG
jgi:hypothetical protein